MSRKPKEDQVVEEDLTMYFGTFEFLPNLNITVRKGTKWAGILGSCKAVKVAEVDEDGHVVSGPETFCNMEIIDTLVIPFSDLNEGNCLSGILQFEHDPNCRGASSLYQVMRKAYPPTTPTTPDYFKWNDTVTVVFFRIDPVAPSG